MSTALGTAYGSYYGTSTTVANALCLIMDPAAPEAGSLPLTVAIVGAAGESVGLTMDGAAWTPIATLSGTLSTGGAITSLPVTALTAAITSGSLIMTASGSSSQLWVVSSTASIGATSIAVNSQTPNFAYPTGSKIGSTIVLDTVGQGLYTGLLPAFNAGNHTLAGRGSNSGTYDLTFPIKFNPLSTASDTNSPTAPVTTQQTRWRFFDPQVSTYTPNQVTRYNLAARPRCDSYGTGQEWAFNSSATHGTYSLLTGQTTPLTGVTTAVRKTAGFQAATTSANFYANVSGALTGGTGSTLSTGAPITSIPVGALTVSFASGSTITLTSGAHTQNFTLTATASVGATSLSVSSATPNFAYPVATLVTGPITAIPVAAIPFDIASGTTLTLTSGANTQTSITTLGATVAGDTLIHVSSFVPNFVYPTGSRVTGATTRFPVTATTVALSSGQKVAIGSQIFTLSASASIGATFLSITATAPAQLYPIGSSVQTADSTSFLAQLTGASPDQSTAAPTLAPSVRPGSSYTLSFYVRATTAASLTCSIKYAFYDITGAIIGTATTVTGPALTSGVWARASATVAAPVNAAMIAAYATTGAPNVLDTIDTTGVLVEHLATLGSYFDGFSTGTDTVYFFAGIPGMSVAAPGYYEMAKNPEKWTSPNPTKTLAHTPTPPVGGQILAWESGKAATVFQFTGVTTTQNEYLNLQAWADKPWRFWLVDHRNIARLVMFTQLDIVPRNAPNNIWASDYTMHVTQYKANDGFSA